MASASTIVMVYLATISCIASVIQGICGFGDIAALQVLWRVGARIAPNTFHSTILGHDDVRIITYFSYVRCFFMQIILTAVLFHEERRVNRKREVEALPPRKSRFNWQFALLLMVPMLVGAYVGVKTVSHISEIALRVILGASSFFFALTLLSLYMMQRLETRRIQEVIKEDLMLMRTSQQVRRHEELKELEALERRKASRARRRRLRKEKQWREMVEAAKRQGKGKEGAPTRIGEEGGDNKTVAVPVHSVPATPIASDAGGGGDGKTFLFRSTTAADKHPLSLPSEAPESRERTVSAAAAAARDDPASSNHRRRHHGTAPSASTTTTTSSSRRYFYSRGSRRTTPAVSPVDDAVAKFPSTANHLEHYIRVRLHEISHEESDQSAAAATTLQAIREVDEISQQHSHSNRRRRGDLKHNASRRRGSGRNCEDDEDGDGGVEGQSHSSLGSSGSESHSTSRTSSSHHSTAQREGAGGDRGDGDENDDKDDEHVPAQIETFLEADDEAAMANLHHSFSVVKELSANPPATEREWSKSVDGAVKTSATANEVNVAMREVQQQQLEALQRDAAKTRKRWKKIRFLRVDGAVLSGAVVSSFLSGLLSSYTGVGIPAQVIFVLAMNISGSMFKMNYAVSSVLPAALRVGVGIYDGTLEIMMVYFYFLAVIGGVAGLALVVAIGHQTAVHGFFMSVVVSLLLTALAMLTDSPWVIAMGIVLAVAVLVYTTRKERLPPEHRVPPPPPNTPATAGEMKMFEDYWNACAARMGRLRPDDNGSFGSDFSFPDRSCRNQKRVANSASNADRSPSPPPPPRKVVDKALLARDNESDMRYFMTNRGKQHEATDVAVVAGAGEDDAPPPLAMEHTQAYSEAPRPHPAPPSMGNLSSEAARRPAEDEEILEDESIVVVPAARRGGTTWL